MRVNWRIHQGWKKIIFFITVLISSAVDLHAQIQNPPAVPIAESNHPLATAYNNGRRMVRDSKDQRYVVYQDFNQTIPIVCFSRSEDGRTWSSPDTLAEGAFPSIAVDKQNRLYLVWQAADTSDIYFTYSMDSGSSWKTPPINVSHAGSGKAQFPVVEAGQSRVHLAWQQEVFLQPWRGIQEIFYTSLSLDSLESNFAPPINISRSENDSKFPSIAHNLGFEEGDLHVVWYDSVSTSLTMIMYRAVAETLATWYPALSQPPYVLSKNCGTDAVHPAVSVEWGEFVHVVWGTHHQNGFYSFLFQPEWLATWKPIKIQIPAAPFISIDDVIIKSSAIVWMNNNEIYYIQSRDAEVISQTGTPVSQIDTSRSLYPSICYKHVCQDSLDVVWTEGNAPPYRIMYRRMEKIYSYQEVEQKEIGNQRPQKFDLKPNYPNPFNSSTVIAYEIPQPGFITLEIYNLLGQKVRTLVAENKPAGYYQTRWDGLDELGKHLPSGLYFYRMQAGHQTETRKAILMQ